MSFSRLPRITLFYWLCAGWLVAWPVARAQAQDVSMRRLLNQANRAARRGNAAEAARLYQQVLVGQPTDLEANFGYGSFLVTQRRDLPMATQCLRLVHDTNANYNPQLATRMGQVLHLSAQYAEAIPFFETAVQALRNTPSADDLFEEDGPEMRVIDASHRFSASALLLQSRKELDECRAALDLRAGQPLPAEVTALGPTINTSFSEFAPVVNDNGRMLLFASRRVRGEAAAKADSRVLPHENIYYALRDENGGWGAPKEVGRLNSQLHESPLGFSPDGRNLYMYRDINGGDVYVAKRTGEGNWAPPAPLGKPINSPYYEPSFCLSPDGKAAFFASDRPDGFGGLDLYITTRQPDGSWSPAFNLGASINTAYDEDSPFISNDNATLYFSSRGHNSIGGFDIFRSTTDGPLWSEPQNLGLNVNSPFDELHLTLGESDTEGFFASDRPGSHNKDLYAVRFGKWIPTDSLVRIEPVASLLSPPPATAFAPALSDIGPASQGVMFALSGKIIDGYTGQALPADLTVVNRTTRQTVAVGHTEDATGRFRIMLPSDGTPYALEIQRPDYMFYTRNIDVPRQLSAEADLHDIALAKLEVGRALVLNNLYFDYGKATIASRSQPELKRLVDMLKNNSHLKIEIGGHTDNKGSAEFNQRLSEQRAASVVKFIEQRGIPASRLRAIGYGLRQPVVANDTEANRQRNRRTELKVLEN